MANWIKNFGRSVKFTSIDLLKETVPSLAEFKDTNSETVSE